MTAGVSDETWICLKAFRSYHFVGLRDGTAYAICSLPSRTYLIAIFVPSLVMMRQVTLSCAGGPNSLTGWPSISTIVSPGRNPAFHAGPSFSTQPMVVELLSSFTGLPTPRSEEHTS